MGRSALVSFTAPNHNELETSLQDNIGERETDIQGQIDSLWNVIVQIQAGRNSPVLPEEEHDQEHEISPPSYRSDDA